MTYDRTKERYKAERKEFWSSVARLKERRPGWGGFYHKRLRELYRFVVPEGMRVLELGCGDGDLLAAVNPSYGVGIDLSWVMIHRAKKKHPHLQFLQADAHELPLRGPFDYIILSDLVNDLWDVQGVLEEIFRISGPHTRLVINTYSRLWELPLKLARAWRLAMPSLTQNWLTVEDMANLLELAGFEVIRHDEEILLPLYVPLLSSFANILLVKLWPFHIFALTHLIVARPCIEPPVTEATVSVIVPVRNEAGTIPHILARVPAMGGGTEIIFVEGHSKDASYETIRDAIAVPQAHPCRLFRQEGVGKGDAVRLGFSQARGDILMILDGDLTVPPEDLPRFYHVLIRGMAEFANGVRLVYPMEKEAMRFINLVGNKFFSLAFTWILGQAVKDTLCGTKALWRRDYERIAAQRSFFGDFDPFGDFDLLFGAARLNLKIRDIPVRYRDRTYGRTNIQRWRHGWLLMRMVCFALRRMKFI
ncbi:MAG: glycosyltransferase [Syntrophales bacterium]|nr:glycosyltransferase [Syntrophales bacterium]